MQSLEQILRSFVDADIRVDVRSPLAVRYLASAPGQLGLARAYITGAIDVDGDLHDALAAAYWRGLSLVDLPPLLAVVLRAGLRRPPVPPEEAPPRWRRGLIAHTRARDANAIARHYDVSNRFYGLMLGPSMAYSCAVFPDTGATLEEAQAAKFDLVCRKLDLQPGDRLLDVGAGWGGMVLHAATHYGARATGVTLSRAQADWATHAIDEAGLSSYAKVKLVDYRDLGAAEFDAISSIGAMEHFGTGQLASHFASMSQRLTSGGRMLNHCITRPSNRERQRPKAFIDRYVFPDGELQGPATVIGAMHDNGFELRHTESLREHYTMTLRNWSVNLERRWGEAVAEAGERRARAWRLYLAMSRLGFEVGQIQLHQMLGVRCSPDGSSFMPLRPNWDARPLTAAPEL